MKLTKSFFEKAEPVKPVKKFLLNLLDFAIVLVLAVFIYGIGDACMSQSSIFKGKREEASAFKLKLYEEVDKSKLSNMEDEVLLSSTDVTINYLTNATYTSLIKNGTNPEDLSKEKYKDAVELNGTNDNLFYYYVTFREENKEQFINKNSADYSVGIDQYKALLLQESVSSYYELKDNYLYLTNDAAKAIDSYLLTGNYAQGETIYTAVYQNYYKLLSSSVDEYIEYYQPYVDLYNEFTVLSNDLLLYRLVEMIVSYVISVLVCFLAMPFCFKNGKTFAYRFFKTGVCRTDGNEPKFYNIFIRFFITLLTFNPVISIIALLLYGTSGLNLIFMGSLNFFSLFCFSALYCVFSFIFQFVNKKRYQTICDFLSLTIVKSSSDFVVTENKDSKDVIDVKIEGNDDGVGTK
jgi:uncharacterized RDD family membrane protein YckC